MKESIELHTIGTFRGKEYEMQELMNGLLEENNRLNNIIDNMQEELMTIYLDIMEYNEDYAKREIKKLKGDDKE